MLAIASAARAWLSAAVVALSRELTALSITSFMARKAAWSAAACSPKADRCMEVVVGLFLLLVLHPLRRVRAGAGSRADSSSVAASAVVTGNNKAIQLSSFHSDQTLGCTNTLILFNLLSALVPSGVPYSLITI